MRILVIILAFVLNVIPSGRAFLEPLQKRDSILVGDQVRYGIRLDSLGKGTAIALPDFSEVSNDTLTLVSNWQTDTIGRYTKKDAEAGKPLSIRASVVLAPFEEGTYELPAIPVAIIRSGHADTLLFEAQTMDVKTLQLDTAGFEVRDLKGQMTYPVTFREIAPWLGGGIVLAGLIVLAVWLLRRYLKKKKGVEEKKDPAYIVALRKLEGFRSDKYWAPEKQKLFYSGITDALKEYIDDRFGVDAPEMTTAELFAALKGEKDISPELYMDMKSLFERADFVKFAKFAASDEENASVLPVAVRFVTSTYQIEMERQEAQNSTEGGEAVGN